MSFNDIHAVDLSNLKPLVHDDVTLNKITEWIISDAYYILTYL